MVIHDTATTAHATAFVPRQTIIWQPTSPAESHRAAARAYIGEHLTDPSLSAARVAQAIGVSERHLSRVFAEQGGSVPRYIRRCRLDRAHRLLLSPAGAAMSIGQIAAATGFTSPTHFSHVFSRQYGIRASDLRRITRARTRTQE